MNKKLNYCPYCGEKVQDEGVRFCWSCGKELPKIETPSTPSQALESEVNPTSDNSDVKQDRIVNFGSKSFPNANEGDAPFNTPRSINIWANKYVKFPPHARGENYLESKDHDYKEPTKLEPLYGASQLYPVEENSANNNRDVKHDRVVNTIPKNQKQRDEIYQKNKLALALVLVVIIFCVLLIFTSFLDGNFGIAITGFIGLIISLMVIPMILMAMKENKQESPKAETHPATSPLWGSMGNPTNNDNAGTKRQETSKQKYERYKNILYSILFFYVICWLITFLEKESVEFLTIPGLISLPYIIVLILKAMKKFKIALGITIILALYWFLAVMSNLVLGYPSGYFTADYFGHSATNFIGFMITGIIMGFILSAMKKNKT